MMDNHSEQDCSCKSYEDFTEALRAMVAFADEAEDHSDSEDELMPAPPMDIKDFVIAVDYYLEDSLVRLTALEIVRRLCKTSVYQGAFRGKFADASLCGVLSRVFCMAPSAPEVSEHLFPAICAFVRKSPMAAESCTAAGLEKLIVQTMRRYVNIRAVQVAALDTIYNFKEGDPWHEAKLFHAFLAAEREHSICLSEVVSRIGTFGPKLIPSDSYYYPRSPDKLHLALSNLQLEVEPNWREDGARKKKLVSLLCQGAGATGQCFDKLSLLDAAFAFNSGIWIALQLPSIARAKVLACLGGGNTVPKMFHGSVALLAQPSLQDGGHEERLSDNATIADVVLEGDAALQPPMAIDPEEAASVSEQRWASSVEVLISKASGASVSGTLPKAVGILTFGKDQFAFDAVLLQSPPAQRAIMSGVNVKPDWANGAKVFVADVNLDDFVEARIEPLPRHVVVYKDDVQEILRALSSLPSRQRPRLKPAASPWVAVPDADDISLFGDLSGGEPSMSSTGGMSLSNASHEDARFSSDNLPEAFHLPPDVFAKWTFLHVKRTRSVSPQTSRSM